MSRAAHSRRWHLLAVFAILVALLATTVPQPVQAQNMGRTKLRLPEPTDSGDWFGTWYYVSREKKLAFWVRGSAGQLEYRFRLLNTARSPESFTTDWSGQAEYVNAGRAGTFSLTFDEVTDRELKGRWVWEVRSARGVRSETADVTLYRSGRGRQLTWKFENILRAFPGAIEAPGKADAMVWVFKKGSRREASWAELPF